MASELSREALRRLARLGAARRLEELRQEEAAIRAAFPDLDDDVSSRQGRRGLSSTAARKTQRAANDQRVSAAKAKRHYKMSPAQKRAVSERMKKYWAAKRKAS